MEKLGRFPFALYFEKKNNYTKLKLTPFKLKPIAQHTFNK